MKWLLTVGMIWVAGIVADENAESTIKLTKSEDDSLLWNVEAANCWNKIWLEECKEGSKIFETRGHISQIGCNHRCASQKQCKSFAYNDDTKDCALFKVSGKATTRELGLSEPDLKLVAPSPKQKSMSRSKKNFDCSEFTFAGCDEDKFKRYNVSNKVGPPRSKALACQRDCNRKNVLKTCQAFYHDKDDRACWLSDFANVDDIIITFCNLRRGRAERNDPDAYDECILSKAKPSEKECMRGNCDPSYLGVELKSEGDRPSSEKLCKETCAFWESRDDTTQICTNYEFNRDKQTCKLFEGKQAIKSLDCKAIVGKNNIGEDDKDEIDQCYKGGDDPEDVNCGNRTVPSCSECGNENSCNSDCTWKDEKCVDADCGGQCGNICWDQCGETTGKCPEFCGNGLCCRQGQEWEIDGCDGSMGGEKLHICVESKEGSKRTAED